MGKYNYWEYLRFNEYEDVFIEDDHYLYVECEPFGWAHLLCCMTYYAFAGHGEWVGADCEYLRSLPQAPYDVARAIIEEITASICVSNMTDDCD